MDKWLALAGSFAPLIFGLFGIPPVVADLATNIIQTVEATLGAGTGAAKKAAVLTGVSAELTALNATRVAAGHPVVGDPAQITTQLGGAIDLVVTVVNAVHTTAPAALPIPPIPTAVSIKAGVAKSVAARAQVVKPGGSKPAQAL